MIPLTVFPDAEALATATAERAVGAITLALTERGVAGLAVSGGATPVAFLADLGSRALPWDAVHVFQVDERIAPDGHPDRNLNALAGHLKAAQVHAMPVTAGDLPAAAAGYGRLVDEVCGGVLDWVHLGIGDDGHTASWPPGEPLPDGLVAVTGPMAGRLRMTLTPVVVNRARARLFQVAGAGKAGVLARLLAGDATIPAAAVAPVHTEVVADRAAAPPSS